MEIVQLLDPIVNPSGTLPANGVNTDQQLVLYNSSLSALALEFPDKTTDILPPSWVKSWKKQSPIRHVKYSTLFTLNMKAQPVSSLYGSLYEKDEHVPDINMPLQYVYNVGNGQQLIAGQLTNAIYGFTNDYEAIALVGKNNTNSLQVAASGVGEWDAVSADGSVAARILNISYNLNTPVITLAPKDIFNNPGQIVHMEGTFQDLSGNRAGLVVFIPKFNVVTNEVINAGSSAAKTLAGANGIPSNASGVLIKSFFSGSNNGNWLDFRPHLGSAQLSVGNYNGTTVNGGGIVQLASGTIDVLSNGTGTNTHTLDVIGYIV